VTGKGSAIRVGPAPAGSEPISGSWLTTKMESLSDNTVTFTYKVTGDTLAMTNPTGQSYTAKLDGTEAPYTGDPGVTTVSVKRVSPNVIEETDKRGPKTVATAQMAVAADGKSMHVTYTATLQGRTYRYVAVKQ
jgi:endonuclease YncB( thermonuclease family)